MANKAGGTTPVTIKPIPPIKQATQINSSISLPQSTTSQPTVNSAGYTVWDGSPVKGLSVDEYLAAPKAEEHTPWANFDVWAGLDDDGDGIANYSGNYYDFKLDQFEGNEELRKETNRRMVQSPQMAQWFADYEPTFGTLQEDANFDSWWDQDQGGFGFVDPFEAFSTGGGYEYEQLSGNESATNSEINQNFERDKYAFDENSPAIQSFLAEGGEGFPGAILGDGLKAPTLIPEESALLDAQVYANWASTYINNPEAAPAWFDASKSYDANELNELQRLFQFVPMEEGSDELEQIWKYEDTDVLNGSYEIPAAYTDLKGPENDYKDFDPFAVDSAGYPLLTTETLQDLTVASDIDSSPLTEGNGGFIAESADTPDRLIQNAWYDSGEVGENGEALYTQYTDLDARPVNGTSMGPGALYNKSREDGFTLTPEDYALFAAPEILEMTLRGDDILTRDNWFNSDVAAEKDAYRDWYKQQSEALGMPTEIPPETLKEFRHMGSAPKQEKVAWLREKMAAGEILPSMLQPVDLSYWDEESGKDPYYYKALNELMFLSTPMMAADFDSLPSTPPGSFKGDLETSFGNGLAALFGASGPAYDYSRYPEKLSQADYYYQQWLAEGGDPYNLPSDSGAMDIINNQVAARKQIEAEREAKRAEFETLSPLQRAMAYLGGYSNGSYVNPVTHETEGARPFIISGGQ